MHACHTCACDVELTSVRGDKLVEEGVLSQRLHVLSTYTGACVLHGEPKAAEIPILALASTVVAAAFVCVAASPAAAAVIATTVVSAAAAAVIAAVVSVVAAAAIAAAGMVTAALE